VTDKRIQYIDIARGLAMILIITGHSVAPGYVQSAIYTFHVPLFFFVSGYFFKRRGFVSLVSKNFKRLVVPYLVTSCVVIFYNVLKALSGRGWDGALQSLLAMLYCCGESVDYGFFRIPSCGVIWFLPALFFAMVIVNFALERKHTALIVLLITACSWASGQIFLFPFGLQVGGFASLFLYAGYLEHAELNWLDRLYQNSVLQILLLALWAICFYFGGLFEIVVLRTPMLPLNLIGAFSGLYLFLCLCRWLDTLHLRMRSLLVILGQNTMIVLCVHLLDIRLFPWGKYMLFEDGHAQSIKSFLLIFSIRMLFAICAVWCEKKSRLLRSIY